MKNRRDSENEDSDARARRETGSKVGTFVEDFATQPWRLKTVCSPAYFINGLLMLFTLLFPLAGFALIVLGIVGLIRGRQFHGIGPVIRLGRFADRGRTVG